MNRPDPLTPEERELGVALVEIGSDITNVAVFAGGMLLGLHAIPMGSGSITDPRLALERPGSGSRHQTHRPTSVPGRRSVSS